MWKLTSFTLLIILIIQQFNTKTVEVEKITEVPIYTSCPEEFSKEVLIEEIERMNFKYPEVVMAQAKLETGNFQSEIFNQNNNLFGMKKAYSRISTSSGVNLGHATYRCWYDSLVDYALYTSRYVRVQNEDELLTHLGRYYAQDPVYEDKVRRVALDSGYFR